MNRVMLIGNLTKDCDLSETNKGTSLCRFTIAVNRPYTQGGERETDYFNCTAWSKLAESVAKYAHKGDKVCVIGNVQLRSYEDNKGNKHTTVDVIAQEVEFLFARKSESRNDIPI